MRFPCEARNAASFADCSLTSRKTFGSIISPMAPVEPRESVCGFLNANQVSATTRMGSDVARTGAQNLLIAGFRGKSAIAEITAAAESRQTAAAIFHGADRRGSGRLSS